jgi:hypothetical protein
MINVLRKNRKLNVVFLKHSSGNLPISKGPSENSTYNMLWPSEEYRKEDRDEDGA